MNQKFTFLTALKKYAKTICLLLVMGGASVAGVAQSCVIPANYTHPLRENANNSYLLPVNGGRIFGYNRDWSSCGYTRKHAAIDLCFSGGSGAGVPVYACTSGTVVAISTTFYAGTGAIYVHNDDGTYLNYAEIKNSEGLIVGSRVEQGQKIAEIKANNNSGATMLHLEYYSGAAGNAAFSICNSSNYSCTDGKTNFSRRSDLQNPTGFQFLPKDMPDVIWEGNPTGTSSNLAIVGLNSSKIYKVGQQIDFKINGWISHNLGGDPDEPIDIIRPRVYMLNYNPGSIENEGMNCYEATPYVMLGGGYAVGVGGISTNWENKWMKIQAFNTDNGAVGQAVYVKIIPNGDPLAITNPANNGYSFTWTPTLQINVNLTIANSTNYYFQCDQCGQCTPSVFDKWNRTIKVKAICLKGEPNWDNPGATENQAQLSTYTLIDAKHDDKNQPNKYTIQNIPLGWDGHWIKIYAWKDGGESSDIAVRYVYIGAAPPNTKPINDHFNKAIEPPDPSKCPKIKTTSYYCYKEGDEVSVQISNVSVNDDIELVYCRLPFNCTVCTCPAPSLDRFSIKRKVTSVPFIISFPLPASQQWDNKKLKIIVHNESKGEWCWSNEIYRDVNNIQNLMKEAFTSNDYKWKFAYWCGKAAFSSYSTLNSTMTEMGFYNIRSGDTYGVKYDIGEKNLDYAINGTKKVIMISIRGTVSGANWETNLNAAPVLWENGDPTYEISANQIKHHGIFYVFTPNFWLSVLAEQCFEFIDKRPEAHGGFREICRGHTINNIESGGVWKNPYDLDNGHPTLNDLVNWNKDALYIITGHSLGGAVAELLALKLSEKLSSPNQIICYVFGSPPVGDGDLKNYAKNTTKISNRIHKLWNTVDPTPYAGWFGHSLNGDEKHCTIVCPTHTGPACNVNHCMEHVYLPHLSSKATE